ncbi:MAG: sodium:proton antiporter NhaD [Bacteroidales bacterium]|nr:sodium:proton antiporter NhaD [Bacteroidales bacterium]
MFYIILTVFILGYICIALEHPLKVNKTATALVLGVVVWTLYLLGGPDIYQITGVDAFNAFKAAHPDSAHPFIDFIVNHEMFEHLGEIAETLFFLIGAMTIVEVIDRHHGFRIITDLIKTRNSVKLLWMLGLITFFLSAVLDNLTTTIVMISLLRKLVTDKKDRWFFAGIIVVAANAGGVWSPIGDVTTIMLWIGNRISASEVIMQTFLPSLVSLIVPLIVTSFVMKKNGATLPEIEAAKKSNIPSWQSTLVFCVGIAALLFVPVFKTLTHMKPYMGVLLGLGVLWIITEIIHRKETEHNKDLHIASVISRIDTPSILFFLGILLAVAGLQSAGHLSLLAGGLDTAFEGNFLIIDVVIGVLSSIVDNIPLVAGAMGMYDFPLDNPFWIFLAYCAGTGGSILIIGSAAGVTAMGMEKIDFIWYLKKITPYALLGYFAGAGTYMLMDLIMH